MNQCVKSRQYKMQEEQMNKIRQRQMRTDNEIYWKLLQSLLTDSVHYYYKYGQQTKCFTFAKKEGVWVNGIQNCKLTRCEAELLLDPWLLLSRKGIKILQVQCGHLVIFFSLLLEFGNALISISKVPLLKNPSIPNQNNLALY